MKNAKDKSDDRSSKSKKQPGGDQQNNKNIPESGRGVNQNDDPSEDSKGGGNLGLGHQEGANQGHHQGRKH